jgi:uncharacterized protein (TIGR03086 family)
MDLLDHLDVATTHFGRCLAAVSTDQWSAPTPCTEWDVHYLVAHVVGGNRFACSVLAGRSAADAIAEIMSSTQLGDNPLEAFADSVAAQVEAFRVPGALDAPVDHPIGPLVGRDLLGFRLFDITVHAWDLARAIHVDEALPVDLVEVVVDIVRTGPVGMGFGIDALVVASQASPQEQLLALAGRS